MRAARRSRRRLDLLRHVDVDALDLQLAAGGVLEIVQGGALRAADSRHDLGSALDVLGGDREAEAA